ncbi:uncharacterized protein LOC111003345 [Pieris rapae]|uniref:uncharacterized protein LOC111003345 n=1 Tax=Pieris rapae TaxID=64459 RepID=UPI001E27C44A|nr:uncharacterized protein LOC111003345 [Pieris rapae]
MVKYMVLLLACAAFVYGGYVKRCKAGDTKCSKDSAQAAIPSFVAGIPELGVKTLDPLSIKKTDASSPNLNLIVSDYTITGLKDCTPKKVKYDKAQSKIFLKLECTGQLEGNYVMKGQLLILPIEGKGPLHVTLNNAEFSIVLDIVDIEKNGVKYWDIKKWDMSYQLKGKSKVVFENLFNGNDVLAQAALPVIEESGNEIILEVGSPVMHDALKAVIESVNNFFHNVPISELVE